jgi:hypothetical protein
MSLSPRIRLGSLCCDFSGDPAVDAIAFEDQLKEDGFVPHAGAIARLGELLLAAGVIDSEILEASLAATKVEQLPLGRFLVKNQHLPPEIVIRALKLQSLVRLGKISVDSANEKLIRAHGPRIHV